MQTVLVVDDEKNYGLILQALLSKAGYDVLTASSGAEGLRLAVDHQPDVVRYRYEDAGHGRHVPAPGP